MYKGIILRNGIFCPKESYTLSIFTMTAIFYCKYRKSDI